MGQHQDKLKRDTILRANGQKVAIRTGVQGVAEASKDSDMIVVIDVLRASSTIITAIESGASSIFPMLTIKEARELAKRTPDSILAGERKGFRIPGFGLGNSPVEYTPETVRGKNIILTTTNCTRILERCKRLPSGKKVVIGALLNAWAIAELARKLIERGNSKISIIQAGTRGRQCQDDQICAEVLQIMIEHRTEQQLTSKLQSIMNLLLYSILSGTRHGKRLISMGFDNDVRYCSQLSVSSVVPVLSNNCEELARVTKGHDF
jgi:2-phosphosulfolactate phosphatase